MPFRIPPGVFDFMGRLERLAAYSQGKGYGAATTKHEVFILQSLLRSQAKLAIDVGGNVGNYTAELRKRIPSLEIHTFEPAGTNVQKLIDRFYGDSLTRIAPFALSAETGSATLFSDSPGSLMGSLTRRKLDHFDIAFDTSETVSTIRFEDYWRTALESRPLDMVKIDIEGHELDALKGFGDALRATKVLQFEFGGTDIDTRTFFRDFWYFFQESNFDMYRITPFGSQKIKRYSEQDEHFSITNYIAVNRL